MNVAELAYKFYDDQEYQKCVDMAFPEQKDSEVLFYAALSLYELDKKGEAIAMLRRTLFHKPDHADALRSLAWSDAGDMERLSVLEKMVRANTYKPDDLCLMGELYQKQNQLNEAHHWFQMALAIEPHNTLALLGTAEVHVKLAIRFIQNAENENDIDLNQQMSDDWNVEEVMRFIYDNISAHVPQA